MNNFFGHTFVEVFKRENNLSTFDTSIGCLPRQHAVLIPS